MASNPAAEVLDVFFNGRPAPKADAKVIRVRLTPELVAKLAAGDSLMFTAGSVTVVLIPKYRRK